MGTEPVVTLIADTRLRKGTRPDFSKAARPDVAEHRGGADFGATRSEDGTELTAGFVLDDVDENEPFEVGHAVLAALAPGDCTWTVTVLETF